MPDARRSLAAALTTQIAATLPVFLVGALASHLRSDLGLSAQVIGAAISVFYGSSALAAYPLGRLCDAIGWHRAAKISMIGTTASLAGTGLLVAQWWHLVAILALGGLSHSFASSAASVALAQDTPARFHGVLFGIKQSAIPVATMMAGLSIPVLVDHLGYRPAFVLAVVLPVLALVGGRGTDAPHSSPAFRGLWPSLPGRLRVDRPLEVARARLTGGSLDLRLMALMLSCATGSAGTSALGAFFVVSAVDNGVTASRAGVTLAIASGLSIGVRIAGGLIADRSRSSGFLHAAILLLIGSLGYVLLATGSASLLLPAALLAYGAGWGWPGLAHFGAVRYRPTAPGTVTGVIRTGLAGGATQGPLAYGGVSGLGGYDAAWRMVAVCAAVAGTCMLLARPRVASVQWTAEQLDK